MGRVSHPLSLVPRKLWNAQHRFDDPGRRFRTLYVAEERLTALRETLQDLRPSTVDLAEAAALDGDAPSDIPPLSRTWRKGHVLAPGHVELQGELADLTEPWVRFHMERRHPTALAVAGMLHLDLTQVTSKARGVTQLLAAGLYEHGLPGVAGPVAGISFLSNLDGRRCYALFEERYEIRLAGEPNPLAEDLPELVQVCAEWGLELQS